MQTELESCERYNNDKVSNKVMNDNKTMKENKFILNYELNIIMIDRVYDIVYDSISIRL